MKKARDAVEDFDPATVSTKDPYSSVRPLENLIKNALSETFGAETEEYNRFVNAAHFNWPINMMHSTPHAEIVSALTEERQDALDLLNAAIDLLTGRIEDAEEDEATSSSLAQTSTAPQILSKRVFIVHGHKEGPKEAVARFLNSIGLIPVILHEQANKGRTIIEKFREEASQVGFAIVLITPDDEIVPGDPSKSRARQNVIFELGFFLGALGPAKVAALVTRPVETPSDYDGVVWTDYDGAGAWKIQIAKEMEAVGYSIDWNNVMRAR
ncbi:TIR domain-containing protein [Phyllobacterium zundukense]|nr:nucleotide-binding protein [Phyllobacterium zundukense]